MSGSFGPGGRGLGGGRLAHARRLAPAHRGLAAVQLSQRGLPCAVGMQKQCQPRRRAVVRVRGAQGGLEAGESAQQPDAPRETFVSRVLKPLRDFGFGRTSFWEGGVGVFILGGIGGARPSAALPLLAAISTLTCCWA